ALVDSPQALKHADCLAGPALKNARARQVLARPEVLRIKGQSSLAMIGRLAVSAGRKQGQRENVVNAGGERIGPLRHAQLAEGLFDLADGQQQRKSEMNV